MPPKKGKGKKEDAEEQRRKEEEELARAARAAAEEEEAALLAAEEASRKKMEDLMLSLKHMHTTTGVFSEHNVVVQKMINMTRDDLLWTQYMKCDGMPDPVCVKQMNTYLSLWQEDKREVMDEVIKKTEEVLPLMNTMERLLESPEEWEVPIPDNMKTRSHLAKLTERHKIFDEMKSLQLTKLNRATYAILLDVSPIVDPENNVLQHYMESDIVQLGLWGNVVGNSGSNGQFYNFLLVDSLDSMDWTWWTRATKKSTMESVESTAQKYKSKVLWPPLLMWIVDQSNQEICHRVRGLRGVNDHCCHLKLRKKYESERDRV